MRTPAVFLALALGAASLASAAPPPDERRDAREHLKANAGRYRLKADLSDLHDGDLVRSPGGTHVRFQQTLDGVPVDGGVVNVGIDAGGVVQLVTSAYKQGLPPLATTALVSADAAIATARDAVGVAGASAMAAQLVVHADGPAALAWKVTLSSERPAGAWDVFLDAQNGLHLESRPLLRFAEGRAQVFNPNPVATLRDPGLSDQDDADYPALTAAYAAVKLLGLDGSGYLRGSFADASGKTPAKEPSLRFFYTRDDHRFEQVMAYYHVDRVQRYVQSLGFSNVNNRIQRVKVSTFSYDNSYYNPANGDISLGRGGVDDGEDADVIVHEYGHAVQDDQVPGFGTTLEAGSMGEGFGDYLAFTASAAGQTGDYLACVAEWDATSYDRRSPPCLRRLDEDKHYPQDIVGEVHADGEIWSRALFDIWNALGKMVADRLVFESHFFLTPSASFRDGANAILAADRALNRGRNQARLRTIFGGRGIPVD